jgi:hypothetical protein
MTITVEKPLLADGIYLHTLGWNVSTYGGREDMPGVKGEPQNIAGRSGIIPAEDRPFDAPTYVLSMWVVGCNADGLIPSNSSMRREYEKNLANLKLLFGRGKVILLEQQQADDTWQRTLAIAGQSWSPETQAGGTRAEFNIQLTLVDVFWEDPNLANFTSPNGLFSTASSTGWAMTIDGLAGANAPTEDAVLTLTGPMLDPQIIDTQSGHRLTMTGFIPSGQLWVLDSRQGISTLNGASNIGSVGHFGSPRLMRLCPRLGVDGAGAPYPVAPEITVFGGSTSSVTSLAITARRKFF